MKACVLLAGLSFLLASSACVELTGQRIAWFYDAPADELRLLLLYEGVHDTNPTDPQDEAIRAMWKFVKFGDIMLVDWPGHMDMADMRERLESEEDSPLEREVASLVLALEVENLGWYREPNGRVGGIQRVTIPQATAWIKRVNAAISSAMADNDPDESSEFPHTPRLMRAAARRGHNWITLDGHALRVTVPVHPSEWAQVKGYFFTSLYEQVIKDHAEPDENGESGPWTLAQLLGSAPFSYLEGDGQVTFILGAPKTPPLLRFTIRDAYEPSPGDRGQGRAQDLPGRAGRRSPVGWERAHAGPPRPAGLGTA